MLGDRCAPWQPPSTAGQRGQRRVTARGGTSTVAPFSDDQVVEIAGIPCLDLPRTVLDVARDQGYRQGLVAADSALRLGATVGELQAAAEPMTNWPHRTVIRDVLASATPDTDSIGETLLRDAVTRLGYGVPEVQFGLTADGRTAWCDLRLGRHLFEFDGILKYLHVSQGGLAVVDSAETLREEKERQDFLLGFKLGISRAGWDDVLTRPLPQLLARLDREYRETCRIFGTDISDLAPFRPRGRRPHPERPRLPWPGAAA